MAGGSVWSFAGVAVWLEWVMDGCRQHIGGASAVCGADDILNSGIRFVFQYQGSNFFWNAELAVKRMGYEARLVWSPA